MQNVSRIPRRRRALLAGAAAAAALAVALPVSGAFAGGDSGQRGDSVQRDGSVQGGISVQDRERGERNDRRDCPKERGRDGNQAAHGSFDRSRQL